MFRLVTAVPVYLGFAPGLVRDLWNPLGMRDRGYFVIFAPVAAGAFLWMAISRISYQGLLIGMLLAMLSSRFLAAAYQGLLALVGQEKLMSGRLSVVWQAVSTLLYAAGAFASGYVSEHLRPSQTLFLVAALTGCIALTGLWKPRAVFRGTYDKPQAKRTNFVGDVKRLVKHRAIYPATLILFLWNFAPGAATPLQFYLSNQLHASDAVYSYWNGIFLASFTPTYLLYGYLCQKIALNKLLWWGTILAVPQMIPLAFDSHGEWRAGRGGADRAAGRRGDGRVLRSGDALLSARPAGDLDDAGRRRLPALRARRRPAGIAHLQRQPGARISLLCDRHDPCVRADFAGNHDDPEGIDRDRGRAAECRGRTRSAG